MWNGKLLLLMLIAGLMCFVEGLSAQTRVAPSKPRVGVGKPLVPEVPDVLITKSCVTYEVSMLRICASGNCQEFKSSCYPYSCDPSTNMCWERCVNYKSCAPPARCLRGKCIVPSWRCMTDGPYKHDLFDGIDTTYRRTPSCASGSRYAGLPGLTGDFRHFRSFSGPFPEY